MEIKCKVIVIFFLLLSCSNNRFIIKNIQNLYVADFSSNNIDLCKPSDVDLNHYEAKEFFRQARQVSFKEIHDHYNWAPCYIEGTLRYKSKIYNWNIRAGAIGQINLKDTILYFVCDTCDQLFK